MDSRINTQSTGLRVQIDQSRTRQAPRTDFGSMVGAGLSRTADAVMTAGQLAAPFIPGGAVLSAAITGIGQLKSSVSWRNGGIPNGAYTMPSPAGTGLDPGAGGFVAAPSDPVSEMQGVMAQNMSMNVKFLELQNQMQTENRNFTTLSNVMKTRHETAKNAINNVR